MSKKKRFILLFLFLVMMVSVMYDVVTTHYERADAISKDSPVFSNLKVTLLNGDTLKIKDFSEPLILINFWATWCLPCMKEFPDMIRLIDEYDGKIALIALSIDDRDDVIPPFLKKLERWSKVSPDTSHVYWGWDKNRAISYHQFDTVRVPETIVLNAKREMVTKIVGVVDWKEPKVKKALESILNE